MPQKHPAATVQRCAPSGTAPGADEEDSGATESRVDWVKGRASRAMKDGKPDMAGSGRVERFEEQKSSGGALRAASSARVSTLGHALPGG